ncbi:MAG TPA: DMT family transporter [Terriglobia bacterium]|nr:DMT family transporter [Terriglobia bacterium]
MTDVTAQASRIEPVSGGSLSPSAAEARRQAWLGLLFGFAGCAIFAGSLPATRLAVAAFDPVLLTAARAVIAGLLGLGLLILRRQSWPPLTIWLRLAIVAFGVVLGFPLFSGYAMHLVPANHGAVFNALLPLMTAAAAMLRGGERPRPAFWLCAGLGGAIVIGFALFQARLDGHDFRLQPADLDMLIAVMICGLGYAEGAVLARRLGSWQVICWALVLSLPAMAAILAWRWSASGLDLAGLRAAGAGPLLGLGYVSLFSMFIGFFFWYHGLKLGGIARVGQLQLIQSFIGMGLAALVLGETVPWAAIVAAALVVLCIIGARRFA